MCKLSVVRKGCANILLSSLSLTVLNGMNAFAQKVW